MAKKLKIAFVLDDGLDNEDGVQQYIRSLASWFRKNGHIVHFLVGETRRQDIDNVFSIPKNIRVSFNGNKMTIPLPVRLNTINKILTKHQYDVIHVQMPYSPFFGAKVVRGAYHAKNKPVIVGTFHIAPFGTIADRATKVLGLVLKNNLKKFDRFISVSEAAKKFSRKTFGIDSQVLPNVVDYNKFKPVKAKKPNKKLKVVFLGRLVERKGCRYLIEALHELNALNPNLDYHLDICGKGKLRIELENKVKIYGLHNKIKFRGFVTDEEKIQYLQQADLAIFPSYAGESFGIVLIEAMAAGSGVVIGGDNPGYQTVLNNMPSCLIDVKNTKEFSKRLNEFMTDNELRSKLHKIQQHEVRQYDINKVGPKLVDLYIDCKKISNR